MPETTIERQNLFEVINTLPDESLSELANFLDYLSYKAQRDQTHTHTETENGAAPAIPNTITSLRGIAKRPGTAPNDAELQAEYTDYLTQKYQ